MNRFLGILIVLLLGFSFYSCKKENRVSKELKGNWTFTEYKRNNGVIVTDFSTDKMTFEFQKYKKAYTQTMKGIYRIDYSDATKTDIVDTFRYELKQEELTISKVQKSANNSFLKRRFKIAAWKDNELLLERIDSVGCYIKAVKN